ncbi:MAG: hypothetical protein N2255_02100 [Kiritimatiellae bacterium]|nr:hypothetical protein [Kiritimatiellia bacterium]
MKETGSTGTGTDDGICVFHPLNVAVETDRRLFVADPGNAVILSVVLEYRAVERISFGVIPVMEERRHAEKMIATPGSCGTIGGAI